MTEQGEPVDPGKRATLRRFAALGAVSPLAKLSGHDAGSNDARDAILGYLSTTPGAHFSKLRDDLELATGEAQHHLRWLESNGAVEVYRDGDYKRLFPAGQFSAFEKRVLGYLRRDTSRGILIALLRDPTASGVDLARHLDVSRSTVSRRAAELEDAGLLSRGDGYAVENPAAVLLLVVRYADSLGADAADLAADAGALVNYEPTG